MSISGSSARAHKFLLTSTFTCICHSITRLLQLAVTVSHYTIIMAATPHPLHLHGHSHISSQPWHRCHGLHLHPHQHGDFLRPLLRLEPYLCTSTMAWHCHTPGKLWGIMTPSPASSTLLLASSTASGSSSVVGLTASASAPSSGGASTPAPHVPTAVAQAQAVTTVFTLAVHTCEHTVQRNIHWRYIALYYLVEHMRQWRRFNVVRFEHPFVLMAVLKSIVGMLFLSLIRIQCIY